MASAGQLRILYTIARQKRISSEELRAEAGRRFGQTVLGQLTFAQARLLIKWVKGVNSG